MKTGPANGQRGAALVLTVWLLAILAVVVGEFMYSSRLRIKAGRHLREGVQEYALAVGGYYAALDALGPGLVELSRDDDGRLLLHRERGGEGEPAETKDVPLGEGSYSFFIDDEDGRIDINGVQRPVLVALLKEAGLSFGSQLDTVVDSILDWRDPNREHRLNGAEEDYYRRLEKPYSCKDGPLDAKEEILMVRGMKDVFFFGGEEGDKAYHPLRRWITVYPVDFNTRTAPEAVLEILGRRRGEGRGRLSRYFTIEASGRVGEEGAGRVVRAVVRRESRGSKISFQLLYWNDNYDPKRAEHVVGKTQPGSES